MPIVLIYGRLASTSEPVKVVVTSEGKIKIKGG